MGFIGQGEIVPAVTWEEAVELAEGPEQPWFRAGEMDHHIRAYEVVVDVSGRDKQLLQWTSHAVTFAVRFGPLPPGGGCPEVMTKAFRALAHDAFKNVPAPVREMVVVDQRFSCEPIPLEDEDGAFCTLVGYFIVDMAPLLRGQ